MYPKTILRQRAFKFGLAVLKVVPAVRRHGVVREGGVVIADLPNLEREAAELGAMLTASVRKLRTPLE